MCSVVGGLVGKASQKLTHAFPDLSVQFSCISSPLIRNVTAIAENVSGWLLIVDKGIDTNMNTNKRDRCIVQMSAGVLTHAVSDTLLCMHASFNSWAQSFRNLQAHMLYQSNTHTHRNCTKASCAQSIVVTIIQHMWLICPWQFPSWLGDGLQREIEQSSGGHMTSPDQTIAATNTQDKCQHFDQSSLPFCFYQHTPAQ